jgi:hypothetical protein
MLKMAGPNKGRNKEREIKTKHLAPLSLCVVKLQRVLKTKDIYNRLVLPKTLPHALPDSFLEFLRIVPPQPRRLHIRRALVVGARQHRNHGQQNRLGRLHGRPALGRRLIAIFIFFGRMQDGDAHVAGRVYVWVEDGRLEFHFGRHVRVFQREREARAEEAAAVELAVVGDHEHDLPLEDVAVDEAAADAGDVFVRLHLLQLAGEHAARCCGGHSYSYVVGVGEGGGGSEDGAFCADIR